MDGGGERADADEDGSFLLRGAEHTVAEGAAGDGGDDDRRQPFVGRDQTRCGISQGRHHVR
ncbi:hypothetical protein [Actinacidiphila glaucinigra]|uniref:hypothetical protein n=1 Tax=Actinacidiphila glaucinigra TaxID=235986 RepID=UPI003D8DE6CB